MTGYEICKEEFKKLGWDLKIETLADKLGIEVSEDKRVYRHCIEKCVRRLFRISTDDFNLMKTL